MTRFYVIIVIFFFASCSFNSQKNEQLKVVEKNLNTNLDSASNILKQEKNNYRYYSKYNKMHYLLLKTAVMNRAFVSLDTVSYMNDVLTYFMSNGDADDKMLANYIMGCVCRDKGDSPAAIKYFNEAICWVDTTAKSCDYRQVAKILSQTASIYHKQSYPQMELKFREKALQVARKTHDPLMVVHYKDQLRGAYLYFGDTVKYVNVTNDVCREYIKLGREDMAASANATLMKYFLMRKNYAKVRQLMVDYQQKAKGLDQSGTPLRSGAEFFYYYVGGYYDGIGKPDSALWAYRKLLQYSGDVMDKENGYRGLLSVYYKLGASDSVLKYARLYADFNDSTNFRNSAQEVSKMQALYDYSESQRQATKKAQEAEMLWKVLCVAIVAIGSSGLLALLIFRKYQSQKKAGQAKVQEARDKYFETLNKSINLQKDLKDAKENFEHFKEEKEKELHQYHLSLQALQETADEENWQIAHLVLHLPIVMRMHKIANKGQKATETEWESLEVSCRTYLNDFEAYLKNNSDKLSSTESRICLLSKLEFFPSEQVVLLNLSKQRIANLRREICKKLFLSNTAKNLDDNLRRI